MSDVLITTAISYPNSDPHIGHTYEVILADFYRNVYLLKQNNAKLCTGTDEHGKKIQRSAESKNVTPLDLCTSNCEKFKSMLSSACISPDRFIRTTDEDHEQLVKDSINLSEKYISKNTHKGYYNIREESFVSDSDAKKVNFIDPETGIPYEYFEQETYNFSLSAFAEKISDISSRTVTPKHFLESLQSRLEDLHDLSITRPKSDFTWGIDFPLDGNHIIYVWFDALLNYITARNSLFPNSSDVNTIHIIGKDIVWFHAVIYPAILESCGYPIFDKIVVHGFITDENGRKMSKSVGNVIDPVKLFHDHSADAIRFYFFMETNGGSDLKFNESKIDVLFREVFVKQVLNLFQRVYKIVDGNIDTINELIATLPEQEFIFDIYDIFVNESIESYRNIFIAKLSEVNVYITKNKVYKKWDDCYIRRLVHCLELFRVILFMLKPILPTKIDYLASFFGWNISNPLSSRLITNYHYDSSVRTF